MIYYVFWLYLVPMVLDFSGAAWMAYKIKEKGGYLLYKDILQAIFLSFCPIANIIALFFLCIEIYENVLDEKIRILEVKINKWLNKRI